MDETIYVLLKLLFDFALEVWFSIDVILCVYYLILYVLVNNFSVMLGRSSWVELVLSKDQCVLLKDTMQ